MRSKSKQVPGLIVFAVILLSASCNQTPQTINAQNGKEIMTTEKNKAADEALIRQQIDGYVKAFRTKDLDLIMSFYTPDMVSFDVVPPLQDAGKDVYRKVWEKAFASFEGPIDVELRDLNITTGDDLAFSHTLYRIVSKRKGQKVDYWQRLTFGFRKIGGKWLISHVHVSVPVDFKSGKAVLDLKPSVFESRSDQKP